MKSLLSHVFFGGDVWCQSPLHLAAARGDLSVVQSADDKSRESTTHLLGKTPLHVAAEGLQESVVHELLGVDAQNRTRLNDDVPLLESATEAPASPPHRLRNSKNHSWSVQDMSESGVKLANIVDLSGNSPLHTMLAAAGNVREELFPRFLAICEELAAITDNVDRGGRSASDIGCASPIPRIQELFARLRKEQLETKRRVLFEETVLFGDSSQKLEPWALGQTEFQEWIRSRLPPNVKQSLSEIVECEGMKRVDGFTMLSVCGGITSGGSGGQGYGSLHKRKLEELLGVKCTTGAVKQLLHVLNPEAVGYYKAVLLSCENRSALTDFVWVSNLGSGSFGRVSMCRNTLNGNTRAIKIIMPRGGVMGDAFKAANQETQLQQKVL